MSARREITQLVDHPERHPEEETMSNYTAKMTRLDAARGARWVKERIGKLAAAPQTDLVQERLAALIAVLPVVEAREHADWLERKIESVRTHCYLAALPTGAEFTLRNGRPAYDGTYRKNADGTWDQVAAPHGPLVVNMSAEHLGFCVGSAAVAAAVEDWS